MKAIHIATLSAALAVSAIIPAAALAADDAEALLRRADAAMGGAQLKSIPV